MLFLITSCDEQPIYETDGGAFASFYPETVANFVEKEEETTTVYIESTGLLSGGEGIAYVKVPGDPSIITDPAYDPFSKEIAVPLTSNGETSPQRFLGQFTLTYKNNSTSQKKAVYELEIVRTSDNMAGAATSIFYMNVEDDEFRIPVDSTVVLVAPSLEQFNGSGEEGFCGNDIPAPAGWTPYSLSSSNNWSCSDDGRGVSGVEGDIAMEMNNYLAEDMNPADDWLISPKLDLSSGDKILSFKSMLRYGGTTMKVFYSEDYVPGSVPTEFSWTEIPAATAALDSDIQSFDFVESGEIDLSGLPDQIYVAFQYTSVGAASGESSIARIDDFEIK